MALENSNHEIEAIKQGMIRDELNEIDLTLEPELKRLAHLSEKAKELVNAGDFIHVAEVLEECRQVDQSIKILEVKKAELLALC